ncbi:MAG TPA: site-specific integrase, partial [Acidimicrobiales bacterium]|nr:site-specific integrase [Acidimicrobiales bacterium]
EEGPGQDLASVADAGSLARLEQLAEQAGRYVDAAKAAATVRAYRCDWGEFSAWADHRGLLSLPAAPETLALYLVELAEVAKASTMARRLSSISQAHRAVGHPSRPLRSPFPAGRPGYLGSRGRGERAGDHEPDRSPLAPGDAGLHPKRHPVQGERRSPGGSVSGNTFEVRSTRRPEN